MRKFLALLLAAFLLLVGCTSADDGEETSAPSDDTVAEDETPTGPSPGVTDDAIKIGITYVDLEAIRDVANLWHGDYEAAFQALIDDINEKGGVHGRRLEPIFAPVSPIGTQPSEEACLRLTEDEQVFVALGFFQSDTIMCYLETHETAVLGGAMTAEGLERARAPWFTTEPSEDLEVDVIRAFAEAGLLDGGVGIVANAPIESAFRSRVEPVLEELGVEAVETAFIDAPPGDTAASNAAVGVIAERFRSAGIETVLVYGEAAVPWGQGLERTNYRPQSLFTALNSALAFSSDEAQRDLSVLDGAIVGSQWTADDFDEGEQACADIIEEATGERVPPPGEATDGNDLHVANQVACRNLALLTAMLEAAGEDLNYGTFRKAGEELGDFDLPGYPDPFHYGPPPSADGDMPVYLYDWDPATEKFLIRKD